MNEEQMKALLASLLAPVTQQLSALATDVTALKTAAPAVTAPVTPATPAAPAAPAVTAPAAPAAPAVVAPAADPAVNAQIVEMRRALEANEKATKELKDAKDAADKRADEMERSNAVNTALKDFNFREGSARETAITLLTPHIKRNDQGQIIAGENLPVETFAKDFFTKDHTYLFAPVGAAGSGASPSGQTFNGGVKRVQLEEINPRMTAETKDAAWKEVQALTATLGL